LFSVGGGIKALAKVQFTLALIYFWGFDWNGAALVNYHFDVFSILSLPPNFILWAMQ
jgi:hypothetical protein